MKHSKVFLGLSTALLAIVGVAAAKAHRSPAITYYLKSSVGVCFTAPGTYKVTKDVAGSQYQGLTVGQSTTLPAFTNTSCTIPAYYHSN